MVAQIELRIGDIEMNFRFDVADSVYQIKEQREESQKKGEKREKTGEPEGSMGESKCEAVKMAV